jgi:YVTN family beta-propeller protein
MVTLLAGLLLGAGGAPPTPPTSLLVLSKRDHTLAIIDPVTLKEVARVPVGDDPHEVTVSADGRTAYVSNYGYGAFHTLTPVDLVAQVPLPVIDLGPLRAPHGLQFEGGKVWFTAEGAKVIGRYDPATAKVDWVMGTGQNRTHMLHVWSDEKRIATTNVNSATVTLLDKIDAPPPGTAGPPHVPASGDWNETNIPVGRGSEGFDVSPDGKELWVANAQDGTVSVIDLAGKKVVATLAADVPRANRLKFTPDGKRVLISGMPSLAVIDAHSRQVVKRIPVGHGGGGIQMQPDGARAYAACAPDDKVAVIDLRRLELVGMIDAGGNPDGLAWAVRP